MCHEHREVFSAHGCEVEWVRGELHYLYQFCNSPRIQGLLLLLCILLCVRTAFLCRYNLQQMNNAGRWDEKLLKHAVQRLVQAFRHVDSS